MEENGRTIGRKWKNNWKKIGEQNKRKKMRELNWKKTAEQIGENLIKRSF